MGKRMVSAGARAGLGLLFLLGGCGPSGYRGGGSGAGKDSGIPPVDGGGALDGDVDVCQATQVQADPVTLPVDIIWVIDNSGSMSAEEGYVQTNLNAFSQSISASGIDHRVVLITDTSHINVPPPLGGSAQFLALNVPVGSTDALQKVISAYPMYKDFLRADSKRHLVVVSDDDSAMTAAVFQSQLAALVAPGFPQGFTLHAIVAENGPISFPPDACFGLSAARGDEYIALQVQTGGVFASLCQTNWAPIFTALSQAVITGAALPCQFSIPAPPMGQTLDYGAVNLVYTPTGGAPETFPYVTDEASCPATGGWYYDDPVAPTQLIVCPASCATLSGDVGGAVQVAFGCQTVIL